MTSPYDPYTPVPGSREPVAGTRPEPPAPWNDPPPGWGSYPGPAAAAPAPAADPMAALTLALQRIDQLERQLAQQGAGVGADIPKLTGPTHDLYLADGTHVEGTGAVPTHVHLADGRILPVAYAVAR